MTTIVGFLWSNLQRAQFVLKQWLSGALEASHYTQESIDDKRASLHLFISRLKLIYVRVKGEEKRALEAKGAKKAKEGKEACGGIEEDNGWGRGRRLR
jgi:hypothetical protein